MSTIKVDALQDTSGNGFYPARAWINFNGTGTVAIRDDGNVSSITDNGTAHYTVTFSNSLSSANYSVGQAAGYNTTGIPDVGHMGIAGTPVTSSVALHCVDTTSNSAFDYPICHAQVTI